MTRRLGLLLALLGVSIIAGLSASRRLGAGEDSGDLGAIRAAGEAIAPMHARKSRPRPGEWLATHREVGQTFAAYRDELPNRPDAERTTLYVQPIGRFLGKRKDLLDATADVLARFYGLPVKALDPIPPDAIPARARRTNPGSGLGQIDSLYVLDLLKPRRPRDAVAVLALTADDLWPNEPGRAWNFVFGQASLGDRVGVWSIARFGDPDDDFPLALRRTLKTALHETGHMLGIRHCTAYECGMNGSNHLAESDSRPLGFCPQCEMKVWWACRVDPLARYRRLAEFASANRLDREARAWRKSLEALEGAAIRGR